MGFLGFGGSEARSVRRALEDLQRHQSRIRVEIEKSGIRFKSVLMLRQDVVAIGKPMGWKGELPVGTIVRFKTNERKPRELRLEVVNADFRLPNGKAFLICNTPEEFAPKSPRGSERFRTDRFRNLELSFPELGSQYKILNISESGCRIDTGRENLEAIWSVGEPITPAMVQVGKSITIELDEVIPRSIQPEVVGLEFKTGRNSKERKHLETLVKWLEKWEDRQSQIVAR